MLKVGITGGIGSGKTTVCKLFETLQIPVYYADDRAKWLMLNQPDVVQQLKETFGDQTYTKEGQLNRAYLSSIVFNNKERLAELNAIVHPAVFEDSMNWHNEQAEKGAKYSLKEAALLFETGSYKMLDKIIVVTAPIATRIQRVIQRDNTTTEEVQARIDKQLPDAQKIEKADFVIENVDRNQLPAQIQRIHEQLLECR